MDANLSETYRAAGWQFLMGILPTVLLGLLVGLIFYYVKRRFRL